MKLCMAVTNDKYELPMAVCDNAKELADMYRMRRDNLYAYISHGNVRKKDGVKFVRVET
ncbi:MAG: hypothetical protein HFE75_05030 [Firmicutes bacterium]|jgi:hypothetical protein|nr:hypothetical protein [Bacillota bacterium]